MDAVQHRGTKPIPSPGVVTFALSKICFNVNLREVTFYSKYMNFRTFLIQSPLYSKAGSNWLRKQVHFSAEMDALHSKKPSQVFNANGLSSKIPTSFEFGWNFPRPSTNQHPTGLSLPRQINTSNAGFNTAARF